MVFSKAASLGDVGGSARHGSVAKIARCPTKQDTFSFLGPDPCRHEPGRSGYLFLVIIKSESAFGDWSNLYDNE